MPCNILIYKEVFAIMKMTKKVLTAMIAVSMAATALPAAAMVDDIANTLQPVQKQLTMAHNRKQDKKTI